MDPAPHPTAPPPPPPPRRAALATPVSWAVLAVNVAVFAWVESHGSSTDPETLIRFGALARGPVWAGEPWRLLTAEFLHIGPLHLAANMVFGIPWCRQMERVFGPARFATLYLGSAVGASALSLLGTDGISAGASGALFGVIGAALALHRRGLGSWGAFLKSRAAQQVLLNLAILAVIGTFVRIDQLAHLGGFLTGAAWSWIATRPWPRRPWPWVALGGAVALAIALAVRPPPGVRAVLAAETLGREGRYEAALETLRPLANASEPIGSAARRLRADLRWELGSRLVTGDGRPRDVPAGLELLDQACADGSVQSCAAAEAVRDGN
jgi:rhomboid protease GluP